jgi:hypothetical protein
MRTDLVLVCALFVAGSTGWAADTFESVTEEMIKGMNDAADLLTGIKDKQSADAAKPKLKTLGKKLADLKKRAEKLGKPTKEVEDKLKAKYEEKIKQAADRLLQETFRVANVEGGKEALKELNP